MANGIDPTRLARAMSIEHYHPRRRIRITPYQALRLLIVLILLAVASAAGYWTAILLSRGGL